MNYADAFKIGSKCDGYAKGTYAGIYIKKGNSWYEKVFSVQKSSVSKNKTVGTGVINIDLPYSKVINPSANNWIKNTEFEYAHSDIEIDSSNGADAVLEYDLPIVVADRYVENSNFVPVRLTQYGIEAIAEALKKINVIDETVTKRRYNVYVAYKQRAGKGNLFIDKKYMVVEGTYKVPTIKEDSGFQKIYLDGEYHSTYPLETKLQIEYEDVPQPKYDGLIESLTTYGIVYVKANALDWEATDINNATIVQKDADGNEIQLNINDAVEAARKRMETAKAILATAATLTII